MNPDLKTQPRYDIVQARNINELVLLVNIKTKNGWVVQGGMTYTPGNHSEREVEDYQYCQSIVRYEYPKRKKVAPKTQKKK